GVPAKSRRRRSAHETSLQTTVQITLTAIPTSSGPRYGCASKRPCQVKTAAPTSSRCDQIPVPTNSSSCIASASANGAMTPRIPLRVAIDSSTAIAVNARVGGIRVSQLMKTSRAEWAGENSVPFRSTSDWAPTSSTPAAMLANAMSSSSAMTKVAAASSLPTKTLLRVHERVSTSFQVPYRSSDENMSPATVPAISGTPHAAPEASTTSETANPDERTQTP